MLSSRPTQEDTHVFDGPAVAAALKRCGVTHVVWLPDSELGRWDAALSAEADLRLVRVCREGEAFAVAAGLLIGGKRPIVMIQCTGLFEAGDALRNALFDLNLPLFVVVGVRSWYAHQKGATSDNCPHFTPRIIDAWGLTSTWLEERHTPDDLARAYLDAWAARRPAVALYAE
jgi:sulfopyruvate decarboxylase TPP-binding subunit